MLENFEKIDDSLFWVCALVGSSLFVLQFLFSFLGSFDLDTDSSSDFKWLSKHAIVGFLMMFGWVGLTCKKEFGMSALGSSGIASIGGFIAMTITAFLFKMAAKLKSPGTVFQIDQAIGKIGFVYQRIPKDGMGKISLSLQGFTHEIDALSMGEEIASFTEIKIVKKVDDKTVVVVSNA